MLGQRARRWRSTEAANYNITPARNIIYFFFVIDIYELEPAAPITQKKFIKYIDIFKRVNVSTALYKIV